MQPDMKTCKNLSETQQVAFIALESYTEALQMDLIDDKMLSGFRLSSDYKPGKNCRMDYLEMQFHLHIEGEITSDAADFTIKKVVLTASNQNDLEDITEFEEFLSKVEIVGVSSGGRRTPCEIESVEGPRVTCKHRLVASIIGISRPGSDDCIWIPTEIDSYP